MKKFSPLIAPDIRWADVELEPRFLGQESADCAVALDPSTFARSGADELQRFLLGAADRGEVAILVATIGDVDDETPLSILSTDEASVSLPGLTGSIGGRRLPSGTRPKLAPGLGPAERDLGLRLLNRAANAPWWSLSISGIHVQPGWDCGGPGEYREPIGDLAPILTDALGKPVVAVWVTEGQRWYVVPNATDWNTLLDWIVQQALPTYAPGALRRVRSPHFIDSDLQSRAESTARAHLAALEEQYTSDRAEFEDQLQQASSRAEPLRYGLLYGTGQDLVDAVASVFEAAGLSVEILDTSVGTRSADLLVTVSGQLVLVEVKSSGGTPGEALTGALQRHLGTWPQLRPNDPLVGGVLVVNHQHKIPPHDRSATVYSREEFVASLTFPVIGSRSLFDWWRSEDWEAIRTALLPTSMLPTSSATEREGPHQRQSSNENHRSKRAPPSTHAVPATRRPWWRFSSRKSTASQEVPD